MTAAAQDRRKRSPRRAARAQASADGRSEIVVQGKTVAVSNLDKVLYPKAGFTKGQIIDYYIRVAPVLLPHLRDRPLTLKRYPDGVEGFFFYEKRCPSHRPEWVDTAPIWSKHNQDEIDFCVANDLATLIWAANIADLELHTLLAKSSRPDRPTAMVFDLDPGAPATIIQCAEVALLVKEVFDRLGMECFPKTSGSKGMQLYVPLNTLVTYDHTKPFARTLAQHLERQRPELAISRMEKKLRPGRVLVDWSQNDAHKTTVCAYSLRAKERPTVSTPLTWDEVRSALKKQDAGCLVFESDEALKRVDQFGDLFQPVLKLKQKLPPLEAAEA